MLPLWLKATYLSYSWTVSLLFPLPSLLGVWSIVISVSVCLSARMSRFHLIFCTCYLWPWLNPALTVMWYVMYFWFCGWRHVYIIIKGVGPNERRVICFVQFARWRHRGQSLPSRNACCIFWLVGVAVLQLSLHRLMYISQFYVFLLIIMKHVQCFASCHSPRRRKVWVQNCNPPPSKPWHRPLLRSKHWTPAALGRNTWFFSLLEFHWGLAVVWAAWPPSSVVLPTTSIMHHCRPWRGRSVLRFKSRALFWLFSAWCLKRE